MKIKYKIDDLIKVISHQNFREKNMEKIGLDFQNIDLIKQALKNGDWKIV